MNFQLINPCKSLNKTFRKQNLPGRKIEVCEVNPDYPWDKLVCRPYEITEAGKRVIEGATSSNHLKKTGAAHRQYLS